MIGGARIKIDLVLGEEGVLLFDNYSDTRKRGKPNSYEQEEIKIFKYLLKYENIIRELINNQHLELDRPDNPNVYNLNRNFWYVNGPLSKIIDQLIDDEHLEDAFNIITALYYSYQFRESDNYKKLKTSSNRPEHTSGKSPNTLFNDHYEQITQLKKTLFKCVNIAKKNNKTNGNLKIWVNQFYDNNIDTFKDLGYINNRIARGNNEKKVKQINKSKRANKNKRANKSKRAKKKN